MDKVARQDIRTLRGVQYCKYVADDLSVRIPSMSKSLGVSHLVPHNILPGLELRRNGECVDRIGRREEIRRRPLAIGRFPLFSYFEPHRAIIHDISILLRESL